MPATTKISGRNAAVAQNDRRDAVVAHHDLPGGEQSGHAVRPAHVEVRLGARGHVGRVVRPEVPDRVDLEQAAEQAQHADRDGEERAALGRERGEDAHADDVALGAPRTRELGVLLVPHQPDVHADQREQDARQQQHVDDVEPREDLGAGELAAEQRPLRPRADHRHRQRDARGDAQARAGQQVVGQRVAGEALERADEDEHQADDPVGLARLAERTGEERAEHVRHHRGDEQQRRPVVDLPHEQAAAHVEGDVQRTRVRRAHLDAAQVGERPVVDDFHHRRVEEEAEVGARQEQHDEAVERDLAEHERPVRREDLVELLPQPRGRVVALVELVQRGARLRGQTRTGVRRGGDGTHA
jgi:hypothetical protein